MTDWIPERSKIQEIIAQEQARHGAYLKGLTTPPIEPLPEESWMPERIPTETSWMPEQPMAPTMPQQRQPEPPRMAVEAPVEMPEKAQEAAPFWQRALQVFAAPFDWVDENIIKPGLSIALTETGAVPQVARKPGEDYFEWKKRSWSEWDAPGVNLDVPWSDDPWRVDIRGVMEFAPWLLIPGAGQVGGVVGGSLKAARGIAGIAGKFGKVGRVVGKAIEYSPWGIVEKTAGAALRGGAKAIGKAGGKISTRVEERLFGKIPEPIVSPTVSKLTKFFDEIVMPARKAFEKDLPALRARQTKAVEDIWARVRRGEITATEGTQLSEKATAGGIKAGFAIKPQVKAVVPVTAEVTKRVEFIERRLAAAREFKPARRPPVSPTKTERADLIEEATQGVAYSQDDLKRAIIGGADADDIANLRNELAGAKAILKDAKKPFDTVAYEKAVAAADAEDAAIITQVKKLEDELIKLKAAIPKAEAMMPEAGIGYFTAKETEELLGTIIKSSESGLVARDSSIALRDLLMTGALPEPHHIRDLAMVFGDDFAKAAQKFARLPVTTKDQIIDVLNLPRAVLASGDLSATFRQGLILLLTRPQDAPRAFARQLKGFASEKLTLSMDDALRSRPLYREAIENGVEFTAIRKGARLVAKEEPFASNLAQMLPLVRRSERAFTTFLNEMRMGSYEAAHGAMTAQGATAAEMKLMGNFINLASGRGTLPANLDRYAPVLNTVLFSARYQMSTLQLPRQIGRMLLSKNPYMRKEAAKALITFVGGGASILGLVQATGKGKVELDPRSGDFGKIIIGKTRLDIWRGYVQYARFVAQLLTGERKSAYGNMNKAQRSEITSRFLQSKASPAFGLMVDLLKGESYMGEPLFNETTGFIKTARERLLPLALQDVIDAMEQSGVNGLWTAIPATLGVGVLTYVNDLVRVKEKIAREMGYETWDEIDPKTQREIQNRNMELQTAYIDFDRQVMGTAWGDWRNSGNAIEDVFKENVDQATAQYRETGDGYQFREKISSAFTARRGGYASREKDTRFEDIVKRLNVKDTAESLILLGPEQEAIKIYNDALYGDDMYDEFGDYRFDEARSRKQQLHQQLGEEMFAYVEDYRGMKYEELSPEFQELAHAREILSSYWRVQDQVEKQYGKPRTPSQEARISRIVSRIRKMIKRSDPEVARYIKIFYTR